MFQPVFLRALRRSRLSGVFRHRRGRAVVSLVGIHPGRIAALAGSETPAAYRKATPGHTVES